MEKEFLTYNDKEISLAISESKIDSVKMKDITKKGARVYENGVVGAYGGVGCISEEELIKGARENLKNEIAYPCKLSENVNISLDASEKIIDDKEFVHEGEELLEKLSKENSDFIFSNKIRLMERSVSLANSKSLNLKYKDRAISAEILFKEKSSVNIFDGFVGYMGRSYDRKDFVQFSNSILEGYRNIVSLPQKKKMPVAVSINDEGSIFLQKFISDLHGTKFMMGGSLFSDKLGKQAFNKNFTLYQTKNPKNVYLDPFFDAEGVVNEDYIYPLIEEGVIKSPYTDKKTASEFNIKNTGAASSTYDGIPELASVNLAIKPGEKGIKELFAGDVGILVYVTSGGDFTSSGEFSAPVQLAFLYDGEKILGRLPELQISSNIYKMFNEDFRGYSSDVAFKHSNDSLLVTEMDIHL